MLGVKNGWVTVCVNAQVTSDYAIVATICAAAHSRNITCARPLNVLKFLVRPHGVMITLFLFAKIFHV